MELPRLMSRDDASASHGEDSNKTAQETTPPAEFIESGDRRERLRDLSQDAVRDSSGLEALVHILSEPLIELAYGHSVALSHALPAGRASLEHYQEMEPSLRMSLKLADQATKMVQFSHRLATERKLAEQTLLRQAPKGPSGADASEESTI